VRRSHLAALLLAGTLVLAACGEEGSEVVAGAGPEATAAAPAVTGTPDPVVSSTAGDPAATGAPAPGTTAPAPTASPVSVPEALDLTADTVSDGPLSLASYAGTPVALWFWAPG
jgi:hypothetical protein